jgi:nucleotide-binding universal stress UspA family protein
MMKNAIVLIDFTEVSQLATDFAGMMAQASPMGITLLHIAPENLRNDEIELRKKLTDFGALLSANNIQFNTQLFFGDFFEIIASSIASLNADILFVGTHGISLRGSLAGSAIFKLLHLIDIPTLIVQAHSVIPATGFKKILIPLIPSTYHGDIVHPVSAFGTAFNAIVHILGFFDQSNEKDLETSAAELSQKLNANGIKTYIDLEKHPQHGDFSRSIIEYSDIEETEVIVLLSSQKNENYFSLDDQEDILLNRLCKPVLCL